LLKLVHGLGGIKGAAHALLYTFIQLINHNLIMLMAIYTIYALYWQGKN